MGFKFSPIQKIDFPITDENDALIKTYTLDVGSEAFVRAMVEKGGNVVRIGRDFETDAAAYDKLTAAIRDFVSYALGDGEYDFLFDRFDKNIFAMIELVRAVTYEGAGALKKRMDQNAALYA